MLNNLRHTTSWRASEGRSVLCGMKSECVVRCARNSCHDLPPMRPRFRHMLHDAKGTSPSISRRKVGALRRVHLFASQYNSTAEMISPFGVLHIVAARNSKLALDDSIEHSLDWGTWLAKVGGEEIKRKIRDSISHPYKQGVWRPE